MRSGGRRTCPSVSTLVFEPVTLLGRIVALVLSAYAVVVFAALAAVLGTFFIEIRRERAEAEGGTS